MYDVLCLHGIRIYVILHLLLRISAPKNAILRSLRYFSLRIPTHRKTNKELTLYARIVDRAYVTKSTFMIK